MAKSEVSSMKDEDKWQAESDVRALIDAKTIMADPKRYERAIKCAKEQMAAVQKVVKESK